MTQIWKCGLVRQLNTTMQINSQNRGLVLGVNANFIPTTIILPGESITMSV